MLQSQRSALSHLITFRLVTLQSMPTVCLSIYTHRVLLSVDVPGLVCLSNGILQPVRRLHSPKVQSNAFLDMPANACSLVHSCDVGEMTVGMRPWSTSY